MKEGGGRTLLTCGDLYISRKRTNYNVASFDRGNAINLLNPLSRVFPFLFFKTPCMQMDVIVLLLRDVSWFPDFIQVIKEL